MTLANVPSSPLPSRQTCPLFPSLPFPQDKSRLDLLDDALSVVSELRESEEEPALARQLLALAWSTFLCQPLRDVVNFTEIRTSRRFLRDLGLLESHVPRLLDTAVRVTKTLAR